eukprot:166061-Alexandrium_andersonii.AAC.1
MPEVRLQQLVERQHREVVHIGILDHGQVPEEVPRGRVPVVPLADQVSSFQGHPSVHPGREQLEDVADLRPEAMGVGIREADVHERG